MQCVHSCGPICFYFFKRHTTSPNTLGHSTTVLKYGHRHGEVSQAALLTLPYAKQAKGLELLVHAGKHMGIQRRQSLYCFVKKKYL